MNFMYAMTWSCRRVCSGICKDIGGLVKFRTLSYPLSTIIIMRVTEAWTTRG